MNQPRVCFSMIPTSKQTLRFGFGPPTQAARPHARGWGAHFICGSHFLFLRVARLTSRPCTNKCRLAALSLLGPLGLMFSQSDSTPFLPAPRKYGPTKVFFVGNQGDETRGGLVDPQQMGPPGQCWIFRGSNSMKHRDSGTQAGD